MYNKPTDGFRTGAPPGTTLCTSVYLARPAAPSSPRLAPPLARRRVFVAMDSILGSKRKNITAMNPKWRLHANYQEIMGF